MYKFIGIFLTVLVASAASSNAQDGPRQGIVWQVPEDISRAERDLQEMAQAGVEAVRTGVIRSNELLSLADTIGLDLYVDLPVARLPAARLRDTLQYASAVLDTVLGLAQIHPSIRNIGLARQVDTSDSTACDYFRQLTDHAREQAPAGMRFYYATRFAAADVCSPTVDFVLLSALDRKDPPAVFRRWNREGAAPAGIGALGTWVRADAEQGLSVPNSPQRQARYFEEHLSVLLSDTLTTRPTAVFAFRWRDLRRDVPSVANDLEAPYVRRYGLHTLEGATRPAFDVVSGIYTGRQTIFAFDQGDGPPARVPWTTLLGWGVLIMLGIFYAASPRFRHMLPRYFQAHVFFLESVREGRDVLFGTSAVLLTVLGVSTGMMVSAALDAVRSMHAFVLAVSWLPSSTQDVIVALLSSPAILAILAGCIYVFLLLVWTFILALFTRRKYPMAPSQVLMLVAWTRWPLLLVLIASMVIAVTPDVDTTTVGFLVGAWFFVEITATVRTVFDLVRVSRVPAYLAIPCLLLHPGIIALTFAALSSLAYQPELSYLWHAMTRM